MTKKERMKAYKEERSREKALFLPIISLTIIEKKYKIPKRNLVFYYHIGLLPKSIRIGKTKERGYNRNHIRKLLGILELVKRPTLLEAKEIWEDNERIKNGDYV